MDAKKFRRRVEFFLPEGEADLSDVVTRRSIGVVALDSAQTIRIAVVRTQGTPLGEPGEEGEGFQTIWSVATASMNSVDDSIHFQETPSEEVVGSDVAKIKAGESPWLPDGALVVASQTKEFFPGLYYPETQERLQIQFRPDAQHGV